MRRLSSISPNWRGRRTELPHGRVFPHRAYRTRRLSRFGYVTLTASADNLPLRQGGISPPHEFHYWESRDPGEAFLAQSPSPPAPGPAPTRRPPSMLAFPISTSAAFPTPPAALWPPAHSTARRCRSDSQIVGRLFRRRFPAQINQKKRGYSYAYLSEVVSSITPADRAAMSAAKTHWDAVAHPLSSLGLLEDAVIRIAGMTGSPRVDLGKRAVVVMCADNGVVAEGVTQTGQEVTAIVTENMSTGDTSVRCMARRAGAEVVPVDIGVAVPVRGGEDPPAERPPGHRQYDPGAPP